MIEQIAEKLYRIPPSPKVQSFRQPIFQERLDSAQASAVLVAIQWVDEEYCLLLTKRSAQLNDHASEVSFVGGKQDPEDKTCIDTALREAEGEVGLMPEKAQVLGTLDRVLVAQKFLVTPVVAYIEEFTLVINDAEVEQVFYLPLSVILDEKNYQQDMRLPGYQGVQLDYQQHNIWGGTAHILLNLKNIINHEHKTS